MRARSLRTDRSGRRRTAGSADPSLALGVFGIPHLAHRMRLIHQPLQVIDEALAAVLRILVVASHVDRLFGANLLTVATEDAAELIDLEHEQIPIPFLVLSRNELDTVRGTHCRTEAARDTACLAGLGREHSMRAAPARRDRRFLLGILHGHPAVDVEEMLHGERHTPEGRADVTDILDRSLDHLDLDCHYLPASAAMGCRFSSCLSNRRSRSISLG